jgi:thiamine-monophosphate kinase
MTTSLIDLGERRILKEIIPLFTTGAGDDCACLEISGGWLLATTDPVPPPAAAGIGQDDDPFWMGWLLVTISVSDLAAAGAVPLGFLAAIECESNRTTDSFERLLSGVKASCEDAGIAYVGGNLREAGKLSAVGTALGVCEGYSPLRRTGARDGDLIMSIGQGGVFWRDATRLSSGKQAKSKQESPVFMPRSQIRIMHRLAERKLISAAMDNSDGLLPSLKELASKNSMGIILDLQGLTVPGLNEEEVADAWRFWLGWGDWNVIACVSPANEAEVMKIGATVGASICKIGQVNSAHEGVLLQDKTDLYRAPRLESERFARDSWMTKGIGEYIRMLKETRVWTH